MILPLLLQSITIILVPLYIIRAHIFIPLTLLEILILITFLVTAFDFLISKSDVKKLRTKFDLLILVFLVAATFSVFKSFDLIGGLGILKAYFMEPVIFYYCLAYTSSKYGSKYIIYSLIGVGVWLSLLSLLQKLTGGFSLAPNEIIIDRVSAVYNSANSLALFLVPIAFLTLANFFSEKEKKMKYINVFLFAFFSVIVIWTRSRGGMVAEVIALAIFIYTIISLKIRFLKKIWYVLPINCIFLSTLFLYQLYLSYNFIPAHDGKAYALGDTLQIRYFIWAGTINMLKDHTIYGAGLDGFKTLYSNEYRLPQFQEQFQYPHNLILTFWTETGLFGLFAFLLLVVSAFSLVIRNLHKSKNPYLGASLIAILSYWMLHGVVDVPYFKNDLSLQFWIVIALIWLWKQKEVSSIKK